mgnify:FL=1
MKNLEKLYKAEKHDSIKEYIEDAINKYSKKDAFIVKSQENNEIKYTHISFEKFGKQIKNLAEGLIDLGLEGKRIAIIGHNSYNWVKSYIATICSVGIVMPLDKGLQPSEIELSLKRGKADAIIFEDEYLETIKNIRQYNQTSVKNFISMTELEKNEGFVSLKDLEEKGKKILEKTENEKEFYLKASPMSKKPEELATIIFTSGTTSMSKAVMLSNKNIASNMYDMMCAEKILSTDVNLLFLPLHHTFGSTQMLLFFSNGATTVFCDGLRHIQENLKEYKVTTFVCVPLLLEVMYKNIWKAIEKQGKTKQIKFALKLSNALRKIKIDIRRKIFKPILDQFGGELRFIISGAAAINKEVAKGFNDFGIFTIQGYGLTETSPVLCAENEKHIRYGSVGLPFPSVQIKIENKNEEGIGEITAKGPNVMLGYYEMEEETANVLKNSWFYTGDLGYLDKDGYLFITGRKKNVIVLKNGKNIYPEELEQLITKLPYVAEVMVYGKEKDDDLVVSAKIVYDKEYVKKNYKDKTNEELKEIFWQDIKEINKTMPTYKYVKNLVVTDEPMIKTTTAKIKRFEEIKKEQ